MKILISDFETEKEKYYRIFSSFGYESNELIFCDSFEQSKSFLIDFLEKRKLHIDLIITNESSSLSTDVLKASEFCYFKNSLTTSYSKSNFRICSIPIILYSNIETKSRTFSSRFDSIVQKNTFGNHNYFISECERLIIEWRKMLYNDLDILGINIQKLSDFNKTKYYKDYYKRKISDNYESYFSLYTKILSLEFIKYPSPIQYDWLFLKESIIEKAILDYKQTYKEHVKYDRKNNERTILHDFFNKNKLVLLRDSYNSLDYEKNLYDLGAKTSEECDFILKTEFPDFLNTTFFEVKKEDVTFYVKKDTKRPQVSHNFLSHLEQVWKYQEFSQNPINQPEIKDKLGYKTNKFDYMLLAGRIEEKLEMKEKFDKDSKLMFRNVNVITYEELEEININYLDKFNRLKL